jgi:hypothetical protein
VDECKPLIWGKSKDKLAFVWGQDKCTHAGAMDGGKTGKPILLKDLGKGIHSSTFQLNLSRF